jgi:hypothetical protein
VSIDPRRLGDLPQDQTYETALARLERETVRNVNQVVRGRDLESVQKALVSQLEGRFPGAELDRGQLEQISAAIARGTLRI